MEHHIVQFEGSQDYDEGCGGKGPPSTKPDKKEDDGYSDKGREDPLANRAIPLPVGLLRYAWLWVLFSCGLQVAPFKLLLLRLVTWRDDQSDAAVYSSYLRLRVSLRVQNRARGWVLRSIRYRRSARAGSY